MRRFLAVLVLLFVAAAARPAHACWDGDTATVGGVSLIYGGHESWDPATVIERGRWLGRIDRALPSGSQLLVDSITATCTAGPCGDFFTRHGEHELAAVLRDARRAFPYVAPHGSTGAAPLTIQIFAGDAKAAKVIADRVAAAADHGDWHGFYEAGGFPADNSPAHVVGLETARYGTLHRVVVGAFLTRADANRVLAALGAAGFHGFVRPLAGAGAAA